MQNAKTKAVALAASDEILVKFFKGLGDATRLRIVKLLLDSEKNVSELIKLAGAPQSNISNHLAWSHVLQPVRSSGSRCSTISCPMDVRGNQRNKMNAGR